MGKPVAARVSRRSGAEPHPNAAKLEGHILRYLAGSLNAEALEAWVAAARRSAERGESLDAFLGRLAQQDAR